MPLAGAEALGLALPAPHTQSPLAWPVSALVQDRLLPPPSLRQHTAAEASGVPGRPWKPRGPAAGGHPEEGWQPAGVQLGAWVRSQSLSFLPRMQSGGVWVAGTGVRLRGGLEVSRAPRTHGISSRLDGHQQVMSRAFSLTVAACLFSVLTHLQRAPGLQEAPVAGRPPAPTADLPTQPPSTCVALPSSGVAPFLPGGPAFLWASASPLCSALPRDTCPLGPPVAPRPDDAASSSRCCPCLRRRGLGSELPSRSAALGPRHTFS